MGKNLKTMNKLIIPFAVALLSQMTSALSIESELEQKLPCRERR